MYADSIDNESVAQLPRIFYEGQIVVINSEDEIRRWLPELLKEKIIGFDTETKPSFKKGESNSIALLQLATEKLALLIRVKHTGFPKELIKLVENPQILKIGAAIHDDLKSMSKIAKFKHEGFIDLQQVVPNYGIENLSVRKMAAIVLGKKVSKSQQLSNWDAPSLSEAQQQYAAIDAWVCREIYLKLITSKI
ncbi:MAG TPA: 3'-5' exonuclease [Tenuifilaceae bacterium]|nr:3'-5' exonuclease [Tenuifilaceae bacterium]HPE19234.1 3'-5' exonuclease [Tenuifilaceae bacterium]HPJ46685.1 3'-5' exonuclease [Tenuifilaceae bacterium]HPQ34853.1 3'-5' exonuclease [Tenuifilaceae bacterium]HRX67467.1 3'-5' exonuclease [Tenuifilaceae bacterium]